MKLVDVAYLAGLIDGEGTITLVRETKFRKPSVSIASTSFELVSWCKETVGAGTIASKRLYKSHHKKSYTWTVKFQTAVKVIEKVLPFLREPEKKRRALLIIENYDSITVRNGKYTQAQILKKEKFEKTFFKNSERFHASNL